MILICNIYHHNLVHFINVFSYHMFIYICMYIRVKKANSTGIFHGGTHLYIFISIKTFLAICQCICLLNYVSILHKRWTKKKQPKYILVAVGLIIIVQQCNTTRWKRLDVRFQMIIEPFLCDEYFLRYHQKCKAERIQ